MSHCQSPVLAFLKHFSASQKSPQLRALFALLGHFHCEIFAGKCVCECVWECVCERKKVNSTLCYTWPMTTATAATATEAAAEATAAAWRFQPAEVNLIVMQCKCDANVNCDCDVNCDCIYYPASLPHHPPPTSSPCPLCHATPCFEIGSMLSPIDFPFNFQHAPNMTRQTGRGVAREKGRGERRGGGASQSLWATPKVAASRNYGSSHYALLPEVFAAINIYLEIYFELCFN